QAEFGGGLAGVAIATGEGLANEKRLNVAEVHLLKAGRTRGCAETEMTGLHDLAIGHEHGAFDRVVEFAHVAGPAMRAQGMHCGFIKSRERVAIVRGVSLEKMAREWFDVLGAFTQRR